MNNKRAGALLESSRPIIAGWLPKKTTYVGYTLLTRPAGDDSKAKRKKKKKGKHPPKFSDFAARLSKKTGSGVFTIKPQCKNWIENMFARIRDTILGLKVAHKGKAHELSAGILNLMIAFTKCDDVDIYGFGTSGGRKGSDSVQHVNKTEVVSDRMSGFHDWDLEQGVIRYLVAGGMVDLC